MGDPLMFRVCAYSFLGLSLLGIGVFRWGEGLWGNMILGTNMVFALMFMAGPGNFLSAMPSGALADMTGWPVLCFLHPIWWLEYSLVLVILQFVTNRLSKVRVKYPKYFELLVNLNMILSLWLLYMVIVMIGLGVATEGIAEVVVE